MKSRSNKKKYAWFSLKSRFGDIQAKNTAVLFVYYLYSIVQTYSYIYINLNKYSNYFQKTILIEIQTYILICIAKHITNLCFTNNGDLKEV